MEYVLLTIVSNDILSIFRKHIHNIQLRQTDALMLQEVSLELLMLILLNV